ncbi:c-type cytochrome [Flavobacterium sp.]|uniref:c-type cytochrome n=1 Tax=Flavobacterium sp. TaxID=239 RepID=UPI003F6A3FFB
MKKALIILSTLTFLSCGENKEKENFETSKGNATPESIEKSLLSEGKAIFEGKGTCTSCHQPNRKVIGPSLTVISKIYKENNANMVSFLKGKGEAIVDPSQYEIMKTNFAITKNMSDEELKALEAYILSY